MIVWETYLQIIGAVVVGLIAWRVAVAKAASARAEEWEKVAAAREARIEELSTRVVQLESDIRRLEAEMKALQNLKAKEIATEVALLLRSPM